MYRETGSPPRVARSFGDDGGREENGINVGDLQLERRNFRDPKDQRDVVITVQATPNECLSGDNVTYVNQAFVADAEQLPPNSKNLSEKAAQLNDGAFAKGGSNPFLSIKRSFSKRLEENARRIKCGIKLALLLLYNVFLGFSMHLTWDETRSWCDGVKFLTIITGLAYFCAFFKVLLKPFLLRPLYKKLSPALERIASIKHIRKLSWLAVWLAVLAFLIVDSSDNRYRLVSAAGLLGLLFLGFLFSAHRSRVLWSQVQWGIIVQFVLSLLILRWPVGKAVVQCLGDKVEVFLEYTDQGSGFVFGYLVTGQLDGAPAQAAVFGFKVLCVVIFFSFMVSILYYYGVMQILVVNVGQFLQHTVGTTACESMNAAGNIFLGMTEAPLLIRPYLPKMTKSELHSVLTGGFATIAGSVLAAYINFGVNASHLLSASVMSAPAALAFSKLVYPETEESQTKASDIQIEKPTEKNALEAATNGASTAIALVANIAANLVAFLAFIALLDGILTWFGSLVHWDFLSFEWLLSKFFIPLSLLMGVEWADKENVAQLVGLKTFVNEFVAYKKLADFQKENILSARSEAIATFALCGFSNICAIGIQIGALGAMAPERKPDLSALAFRAMLAGSAACFMTACVAGTLIADHN